ncbi:MAG: efflux RND transporter periplasmic adaptor subunit [Bacteroidales bacterium]
MKRKRRIIGGALLVVVAVTVLIVHGCKKSQSYTFETATAHMGSLTNTVTATGTLKAITSVVVGTQVSGIVEKLYVDFNSRVKKGQILAELDKVALNSQVDQAQATLESAKASTEYEQSNFERSKALFDKNLIAQADYDLAKFNYEQSKASQKNAKASYDKAVVNLRYATIYAPIDGVVMNRAVDAGQTVAANFNTPEIFTIAQDLTQMKVEADIDESDIGQVKVGQRVEFGVDAFPDDKFKGTVMQIRLSPKTTSNVVTYTVIINAQNPDEKLLPGMTADIVVYVEESANVLVIPFKAIKFTPEADYLARTGKEIKANVGMTGTPSGAGSRPQGVPSGQMPGGSAGSGSNKKPTVVWVKVNESIHAVPVVLGMNDGDNAEVKSGLKEGDQVVTKMTIASAKNKKAKQVATNPFMPRRPGTVTKKKTTTQS